jgi:CubicO group peptidase (beta-lactamase class C family)
MKTFTQLCCTAACAFALLFASCSPNHPKELMALPAAFRGLDSSQARAVYAAAQHFPNGSQLSLCIITGDSERYVGILRHNDSLVNIENSDSVFEIGSITKTFTGTMLAKLIRDGKAQMDDSIGQYLPVPLHQGTFNGKTATLVHLANHTSGLPFEPPDVKSSQGRDFDQYFPYRGYDLAKLNNYLAHDQTLQSTPGEKRVYSNLGIGLLGLVLTRISGLSYEQLLFTSICNPLGMNRTFVKLTPEREQMMVRGRDADGNPLPFVRDVLGAFTGCGEIKSSVRDLVKYLRANMTDTTYFLLSQRPTTRYDEHLMGSLAWAPYIEGDKAHLGAFGATGGYTGGIIFERNKRVGVVVQTNVSAFVVSRRNNTEQLCRALYDPLPYK